MCMSWFQARRSTGFTPLPGWMVKSMGGKLTPVEAGFIQKIGRRVVMQGKGRGCRMTAPLKYLISLRE